MANRLSGKRKGRGNDDSIGVVVMTMSDSQSLRGNSQSLQGGRGNSQSFKEGVAAANHQTMTLAVATRKGHAGGGGPSMNNFFTRTNSY